MSSRDGENPDDPLLDALAAYDDRLAAGVAPSAEDLDRAVDPALRPDWNRLTAFLSLVEKAWPLGSQSSDEPALTDANRRSGPPDVEGAPAHATTVPGSEHGHRFGRFRVLRTLGAAASASCSSRGTRCSGVRSHSRYRSRNPW